MHDGLIVRKNADKTIPADVLEKIVKEYPSCMGIACSTTDSEGNAKLEAEVFPQTPDLEGLKNMLETYKAATLYMFFGDYPGEFNEEDVQPHILQAGEDGPLLVLFAVGDFKGFEKAESSRAPSFHAFNDFIKPYVQKMIRDAGQDANFEEFMKSFNDDPLNKQALLGASVGRATYVIVAANGTEAIVSRSDEEGDYPWGYLSSRMDIPIAMGTPPKAEEHKAKGSFFSAMKKKIEKPEPEKKLAAPASNGSPAEDTQLWAPGPEVKTYGDLRSAYQRIAGFQPDNYKERPLVPVSKARLKRFQQLKSPEATQALADKKAELETKGTDNKNLPVSVKDMPIVPAESKEALKVFMANLPSIDEKKLQEMEGLTPTFEQSTGVNLNAMENVPFSKFLELAGIKEHRNTLAVLAYSLVRDRKKLRAYITELEEQVTAPADKAKDEDVVDTSGSGTEEQPKKSSFFAAMKARKTA